MKKLEKLTISGSEKLALVSNLATMLTAGIPILDAVYSLREDAKGNIKIIFDEMASDLREGKRVHLTLAKFPLIFDKVTVSVIRASEEAGTLDVALRDLRISIQKDMEFADKVRSALLYPMFIMIVFALVLGMILIVVIPKIAVVFSRLRVKLPLPTRVLIFLSDLVVQHGLITFGVLAAAVAVFVFLYRNFKNQINSFIFSLPLITLLVQQIDITKFSRSLFLLLSSGLPITAALDLAKDTVIKKKTRDLIIKSREMVLAGKPLSVVFKEAKGYIPSIMVKLMEVGEKTGSLDKAMQDISEYFDYQVTNTLKTLTALLEPVMLVFVGILVGGMMLSIIAPIYGLIGQVGTR